MKAATHPDYKAISVTCSCGNTFETGSTLGHDLQIEVCSACHPFYTGKQKIVDTGGRVDKFRKKYAQGAAARYGLPRQRNRFPVPPSKKGARLRSRRLFHCPPFALRSGG